MSVLGKRTRRFRFGYLAVAGLLLSAMTVTDGAGRGEGDERRGTGGGGPVGVGHVRLERADRVVRGDPLRSRRWLPDGRRHARDPAGEMRIEGGRYLVQLRP